jgi:cell shape-determining protein MreD
MKIILFLFLGILFLALQTTVFQAFPEWFGIPDLLLLLIIFLSLHFKPGAGAMLILLFSIGLEVFSGYFLGLYAIAYILVFSAIKWLSVHFALKEINQQPSIAALSLLFVNAFVYLSSLMLADASLNPWGWGAILQRVLIVTILAIPVNRGLLSMAVWCDQKRSDHSFFRQKKKNQYKAKV